MVRILDLNDDSVFSLLVADVCYAGGWVAPREGVFDLWTVTDFTVNDGCDSCLPFRLNEGVVKCLLFSDR